MSNDKQRMADAKTSFGKLMVWSVVAGVLMTIVALIFLSYTAGPMSGAMIFATIAGVFVSVVLGASLMAGGFLSSNSGHDDNAADHRDKHDRSDR